MLFLFVILLVTIGLPEGGCVVSICYIVGDHWFARGWLCCFYFGDKGLPEGGCVVFTLEIKVCQRVVVLFLL